MIWKRKYLMIGTWFIAASIAAAVVYSLPAIYRAETVIQVESQRIPERFVASTVSMELKDRLATLSQQILSYRRLLEIVEKFDLYRNERKKRAQEEIIEMMRSDIDIQLDESWTSRRRNDTRPSAFRISYQGPNPEVAALVANQLGNLFIDENLRSREVQAVGTSEFMGTQLVEAKKRLEQLEARMGEFKLKHTGELPEQENALIASLGQVQVQLQATTEAVARAEQNKRGTDAALASAEASEAAFAQLISQLNSPESSETGTPEAPVKASVQLQNKLDQALVLYTEDHPEIKALRALLQKVRQQEEEAEAHTDGKAAPSTAALPENQTAGEAGTDGNILSAVPRNNRNAMLQLGQVRIREREHIDGIKAQQAIAAKQIETATAERERLAKELNNIQNRIGRLPIREQELAIIRRDYEISKANYQSLLDKGLSADMAAEMERRQKAERFTTIDPARVPQIPVKPNRPLLYSLGMALSLCLGIAMAMGREVRGNALLGDWELPKGVAVLGRVPLIEPAREVRGDEIAKNPRKRRKWLWILLVLIVLTAAAGVAGAFYFEWIHLPGSVYKHG